MEREADDRQEIPSWLLQNYLDQLKEDGMTELEAFRSLMRLLGLSYPQEAARS